MTKVEMDIKTSIYPLPVTLISSINREGKMNIMTASWVTKVCMSPPQLGVALYKKRKTLSNILETGDFVVNIPSMKYLKETDYCGNISGNETDKFADTKFTPEKAKKVKSPLIKECPSNFECKLLKTIDLGCHELVIGEVISVSFDKEILDEDGNIDYIKANPIIYLSKGYWNIKEKHGYYGFTKKS